MRGGMTQLDAQVTARPDHTVATRLRSVFPFRSVVLPWLLARLLVVPLLVLRSPPDQGFHPHWLLAMDGGWFRVIALDWYKVDNGGCICEYPFFPLFPAAGGALMRVGVPSTVALAGLAWVAALLAMAGARLLAARHVSERAGDLTPWVIALAPGALTLVLGYSDAFFLAALVWAVVAVDHRRWWSAGLLAAAATASRPNGVIAVVAVMAVALLAGAGWRRLVIVATPSVAFLAGWMLYLHHTTGDALLFWHAKSLWVETTFSEFLDDPTHQRLVMFHIVVLLAYVVPYVMRWRRQPPAWTVVVLLGLAPSLALGLVGLARYVILAFPIPIAVADLLAGQRRSTVIAVLTVSAIALMVFARLVVVHSWVP
jgi:hypothetical protein